MPTKVTIERFGITLDRVVWNVLGKPDARYVEQALALNPGVAGCGAILPVGTVVLVPDIDPRPPVLPFRRLWD